MFAVPMRLAETSRAKCPTAGDVFSGRYWGRACLPQSATSELSCTAVTSQTAVHSERLSHRLTLTDSLRPVLNSDGPDIIARRVVSVACA